MRKSRSSIEHEREPIRGCPQGSQGPGGKRDEEDALTKGTTQRRLHFDDAAHRPKGSGPSARAASRYVRSVPLPPVSIQLGRTYGTVKTSAGATGEAIAPDGRCLLVAHGHGAAVIAVARAESGAPFGRLRRGLDAIAAARRTMLLDRRSGSPVNWASPSPGDRERSLLRACDPAGRPSGLGGPLGGPDAGSRRAPRQRRCQRRQPFVRQARR